MKTKLYFAYGMNLDHDHMREACPTAIPIGPRRIDGYRVEYRCFANIVESDPDDCVWGGCWAIDAKAEECLDYIEVYPDLYDKIYIDGMLTYQMIKDKYPLMEPTVEYLKTVQRGLADFGLVSKTINKMIGPSKWQRRPY